MKTINLDLFCDKDRRGLEKPFKFSDGQIASTDGVIAIITNGSAENGIHTDALVKIFDNLDVQDLKLYLPDDIKNESIKFTECECVNYARKDMCPCCHGDGMIETDYEYTGHDGETVFLEVESPCPVCDGYYEFKCEKCDGSGKTDDNQFYVIGNQTFLLKQLYRLNALDNVKIQCANRKNAPSKITFNGGYGLIMPKVSQDG